MAGRKARVKIPELVAANEIFTIKTLISHRMESGHRRDEQGKLIPRLIINHFEASFNGRVVFSVELEPGVSANPFFEFTTRINEPGTFTLTWTDDNGEVTQISRDVALKN